MKRFLASLTVVLVLIGCSGKTDVATVIADAQLVIGTQGVSAVCPAGPCGLTGAYLTFRSLYPNAVSPAADDQVQKLLSSATAPGGLLDQLKAAVTAADQAADLRGVESVANQVLGIVAAQIGKIPGIDPGAVLGFQAAAILLPILEAAANQLVPVATVGERHVPRVFDNKQMTEDQARAKLRR